MRQKSIHIAGLNHGVPIPNACRVGPILATSAIGGTDPVTGQLPPEPDRQAFNCFENLKAILKAGGLDLGDVVKLSIYLADEVHRTAIGKYWEKCFPDTNCRPARHAIVTALRAGQLIQIEALAVAPDS